MRWAAAWLLIVGAIYLRSMYVTLSVISGRMTALMYLELFAGPIILIVAACFLLAGRLRRVAALAASLACAWLTWLVAENYFPPAQYDWLFMLNTLILLLSYVAIFVIWRRLSHLTMRSSQPLTGQKIST
jgi:hypothetical protein